MGTGAPSNSTTRGRASAAAEPAGDTSGAGRAAGDGDRAGRAGVNRRGGRDGVVGEVLVDVVTSEPPARKEAGRPDRDCYPVNPPPPPSAPARSPPGPPRPARGRCFGTWQPCPQARPGTTAALRVWPRPEPACRC